MADQSPAALILARITTVFGNGRFEATTLDRMAYMARLSGRLRKRRCRVRNGDIVRVEPWSFATHARKADIVEVLQHGCREAREFDAATGDAASEEAFFDFGDAEAVDVGVI